MSVDTCGGLASDAVKLVRAIAEEGERWSAGTWSSANIERQLLGAIAVAVQRGNALNNASRLYPSELCKNQRRAAGSRVGRSERGEARRCGRTQGRAGVITPLWFGYRMLAGDVGWSKAAV